MADVQYAGYYTHQPSGLNLTLFRAYDPNAARWLSRDPAGEIERSDGHSGTVGGLNLYGYVNNNPVDWVDLLGLGHGSGLGPTGQRPANNNGTEAQQNAAAAKYLTQVTTLVSPTPLDSTFIGEFSLFNLINGNFTRTIFEYPLVPLKEKCIKTLAPEAAEPISAYALILSGYATLFDAGYYVNQLSPPQASVADPGPDYGGSASPL